MLGKPNTLNTQFGELGEHFTSFNQAKDSMTAGIDLIKTELIKLIQLPWWRLKGALRCNRLVLKSLYWPCVSGLQRDVKNETHLIDQAKKRDATRHRRLEAALCVTSPSPLQIMCLTLKYRNDGKEQPLDNKSSIRLITIIILFHMHRKNRRET